MRPTDIILKLPCNEKPHYFHKGETTDCEGILPWLKANNNCPICRTEFPSEETEGTEDQLNDQSNNQEIIQQNPLRLPRNINHFINFSNILNESYQLETAIERSFMEQ